jgi:Lsr2
MARRTVVRLEDDLDGGEAVETVAFGLDGVGYEIDLNEDNAAALRDALEPYLAAARTARGGPRRARRPTAPTPAPARSRRARDVNAKTVRAWAQEHGYRVSNRGRVPAALLQKYLKATA